MKEEDKIERLLRCEPLGMHQGELKLNNLEEANVLFSSRMGMLNP